MLQELLTEQDRYYDAVLRDKYAKGDEKTADDVYRRVARGLAAVEPDAQRARRAAEFLEALRAGFTPAGRIMSAAGTDIQATLINCFVQPVGDSIAEVRDGRVGIYTALLQAAETMRRGGGVGYDFSAIRPRGARVAGTASRASGPISYMRVFDRSCETVESAGARRGAQMGVLRVDHPDILEFIAAKDVRALAGRLRAAGLTGRELEQQLQAARTLSNFNLSVAVTDDFMRLKAAGGELELVHAAEPDPAEHPGAHRRDDGLWVYRRVPALELWDRILQTTYETADPGVVFIDRMNAEDNLAYCERLEATNPCVTADTWVHTLDGPRQVADLIGKRFIAAVNGEMHSSSPEGFFSTGHKPIFELTTCEGHRVTLTEDHPVMVMSQLTRWRREQVWKKVGELRAGDQIVLNDHRAAPHWHGFGTHEQGYLLGLMIGDGFLDDRGGHLAVWTSGLTADGTAADGARGIMIEAERCLEMLQHRADFRGWQPVRGHLQFRVNSAALRDLAVDLGMSGRDKIITPNMEAASSAFSRGLLRGLFDTDGSVQGSQQKGVSVRLTQVDLRVLEAAQRMLLRLGVDSTIYRERKKGGAKLMPDGRGGSAFYPTQAVHELIVSGDNLRPFAERIGFSDTAKALRLETLLASYRRRLNRARFLAQVKAVVRCGTRDVFDASIPGINAFDANGLVVHNCGEQPLPSYGCCCLGSLNLARLVLEPFTENARLDYAQLRALAATAVRMLDDVLDATYWPLPEQQREAQAKRRLGLGFTGLGTALMMLRVRYGSEESIAVAAEIARELRDAAYRASIELARERGAFPKFDADKYLATPFVRRLPQDIRDGIRAHGIRNSHLLSIAPTGTISLAFGRNVTGGIEPAFAWEYTRKTRGKDGKSIEYPIQDFGYRRYLEMGGDKEQLPAWFASAQTLAPADHVRMQAAVQPYVDSSISKCVVRGTRIVTSAGVLPIEELGEARQADTFAAARPNLSVLCPDGRWRKVVSHYCGGTKPTTTIRLANGQVVTGSTNHRLMGPDGWVRMGDLKKNDHVMLRRDCRVVYEGGAELPPCFIPATGRHNKYRAPTRMSSELALFIGMMCADGHLERSNGHISLCAGTDALGPLFTGLCFSLFGASAKHSVDQRTNVHQWAFNSKPMCDWIASLMGYRSVDKRVPDALFRGSPAELHSFLRGISLDGYHVINGGREWTVLYEGRSEVLARGIFTLCCVLGRTPTLTTKLVASHGYTVYGVRVAGFAGALEPHKDSKPSTLDLFVRIPIDPRAYRVPVRQAGYFALRNWWQRGAKIAKESSIHALGLKAESDSHFIRVVDLVSGDGEVFDIEVEETHDYLIDGLISHNTINCPVDLSFDDFKRVYDLAYESGCKGCTTYRPNDVTGAVLSVPGEASAHPTLALQPQALDRRLKLDKLPAPPLASLKWPGRPEFARGNPAWTYMVDAGEGCRFAVFVGHIDNGETYPFEVWVNGAEQPRGLGATAKLLSMDMRSRDRGWLKLKLETLIRTRGNPVPVAMPPTGETIVMASPTAALARLVQLRCQDLGAFDGAGATPVLDALLGADEPVTGTDGTMSWTVDVKNPATGDDAVLVLKELQMPDGQRRPYAMALYGDYPRDLDGLCRLLSLDMRVVDPAWIGAKLGKLLSFPETGGSFLGRVPGAERSQLYPSTVAYLAALALHRYHMLGILDPAGAPVKPLGVLEAPAAAAHTRPLLGAPCPDCGAHAVVRHEGCQSCTSCGWIGNCG